MAYEHVPARTVRFWALVDSSVAWPLAIPPLAEMFIRFLYTANGWLGGSSTPPVFESIHLLFVCLLGALVTIWVVARWMHPVGLFAWLDGWGRALVAVLLLYFIVCRDAPPVLYFFIFTELAGTVAQLRAVYGKAVA